MSVINFNTKYFEYTEKRNKKVKMEEYMNRDENCVVQPSIAYQYVRVVSKS